MSRIVVTPYNSEWPHIFTEELNFIEQALGSNCITVHHIGSTAVPGLSAKPIIDIIVVVKDQPTCISPLKAIGYHYKGEYNLPFRYYFSKDGHTKFHLHVYLQYNIEIELNLLFRDYLRTHSEDAVKYEALKMELLQQESSHQKNGSAFSGYTIGKYHFIQNILRQAKFDGLRLLHCSHPYEWQIIRYLRQTYFFDPNGMSDPYTWTFNHDKHVHFILYKSTIIIGYIHLQLWPNSRAALRIIVIDESYRGHNYGQYLLSQSEKWLSKQSFKSLHTESKPETREFYSKLDYKDMPFNDPDGYESCAKDIPLGKLL